MTNKMMSGIMVLLFLILLVPYRLCAETDAKKDDSTWSQELQTTVPQTPEDLLLVIKALFANPDGDGHEFFEKQFGIDRLHWGQGAPSGWIESKFIHPSNLEHLHFPYQFGEVSLDRQYKVYKIELFFYKNKNFLMTPVLTRKILGSPTKIDISSPRNENSIGRYKTTYLYETEKYRLHVEFMNQAEEGNKEVRFTYRKHAPEQIQNEQLRRKSFEIHKNYLPISLELIRFEHPPLKRP
jgi:hypothetical protein